MRHPNLAIDAEVKRHACPRGARNVWTWRKQPRIGLVIRAPSLNLTAIPSLLELNSSMDGAANPSRYMAPCWNGLGSANREGDHEVMIPERSKRATEL